MTAPLSRILAPPAVNGRVSAALCVLRAFVGIAFCFHGLGKAAHLEQFAAEFHIPQALAAAGAYTQLVGAVLLLVGLGTPLAALGVGTTMAVAVTQLIARGEPFVNPAGHSWEAAAFYLVANLALMLGGPGCWSLDGILWRRWGTTVTLCRP